MGFFGNLFKTDENGKMGWGGSLLKGALQGLGSGQGLFGGLLQGMTDKLSPNQENEGQKPDMALHLTAANEPSGDFAVPSALGMNSGSSLGGSLGQSSSLPHFEPFQNIQSPTPGSDPSQEPWRGNLKLGDPQTTPGNVMKRYAPYLQR